MRDRVKTVLRTLGYRLTRWGHSNRFESMEETLSSLRRAGFRPSAIIDGGANRGDWARTARLVFPETPIHLIEPLPACVARLREMAAADGCMTVHPYAATKPGVAEVTMNLVGDDGMATSAQVALPGERLPNEVSLPAASLDATLKDLIEPGALLKLDLQGHEVDAMSGGLDVLKSVEVVICEVTFYQVNNNGRPVFADVLAFAAEQGFVAYDFASLAGRYNDNRLQWGDLVLVKRGSDLLANTDWTCVS